VSRDHYAPTKKPNDGRSWKAKLTDDQAATLRKRHAAGESITALAAEYGLNKSTAANIADGVTYRQAMTEDDRRGKILALSVEPCIRAARGGDKTGKTCMDWPTNAAPCTPCKARAWLKAHEVPAP
jgi:hypothetical protein